MKFALLIYGDESSWEALSEEGQAQMYARHEAFGKWLAEKGTLPPHTRASWDTSKRLLSAAATRKLDEFGGK